MKKRRPISVDDEMILEFWRCGYSVREIAIAMGIEESEVKAVIRKDKEDAAKNTKDF